MRQLYPELLKRFDDSSDTVRRSVCLAMKGFLLAAPPQHFLGTTLDYTLDCLFVHLDDPDPVMQEAVLGVIATAATIDGALVKKKAAEVRARQREAGYIDRLLEMLA